MRRIQPQFVLLAGGCRRVQDSLESIAVGRPKRVSSCRLLELISAVVGRHHRGGYDQELPEDLVRPHHVVVLVLEDVAVEYVLLRSSHAWRKIERGANPRHYSRIGRDRVLEATVVG